METGPTGLIGQHAQSPVEGDLKLELVCATIRLQFMVAQTVLDLEQKPKAAIHKHVLDQLVMSKIIKAVLLSTSNLLIDKIVSDGNWGDWATWGTCSVPCGGGTQSRSRLCNNPAPSNSGATCPGSDTESQACNAQGCPISESMCNKKFLN